MPSVSKKQHNFMAAIAHSPAFAKKVGVPQSVGKDFSAADKGKKFGLGGGVGITRGGAGQINKQQTRAGSIFGQQKEIPNGKAPFFTQNFGCPNGAKKLTEGPCFACGGTVPSKIRI